MRTFSAGDLQPIEAAALSPDGTLVAAGGMDDVVRVWTTNGALLRTLRGHPQPIQGLAFAPASHRVLAWAEDGTARLWSVRGNQPPVVFHGDDFRIIHGSISPDGRLVALSTYLAPPQVFDAATGRVLFTLGKGTAWSRILSSARTAARS